MTAGRTAHAHGPNHFIARLHRHAAAQQQAVLQALLDAGASTSLTDREGNTPLALAKARGYKAMVELLARKASS